MHVFLIAEYAVVHNYATNTCINCSNRPFMNDLNYDFYLFSFVEK